MLGLSMSDPTLTSSPLSRGATLMLLFLLGLLFWRRDEVSRPAGPPPAAAMMSKTPASCSR
jgi:hypothetical protein